MSYLGTKIRLSRAEDGSLRIYERLEANAAQDAIGKLLASRVPRMSTNSYDDMPLWERAERARSQPSGYDPGASSAR